MPVIAGFDKLVLVPEEKITDKIRRRVVSGKQGTMVYWSIEAGARAAVHKHPHEQFVWMVKGTMDFRIGDEKRTMKPGDVAVIPGGVEHEAYFPEDSEVIDFFTPVREDFLTGAPPSYMLQPRTQADIQSRARKWSIMSIFPGMNPGPALTKFASSNSKAIN